MKPDPFRDAPKQPELSSKLKAVKSGFRSDTSKGAVASALSNQEQYQ